MVAIERAARDNGLLSRTYRDSEAEFGAGVGTTVSVRAYGVKANETTPDNKDTALTVSGTNEMKHDVTLTKRLYVRNTLSEEDLLTLPNFATAITNPAVDAITDAANAAVAAIYNGLTAHATIKWGDNAAYAAIIRARAALRSAGIPEGAPLFVECSPEVFADLILDPTTLAALDGKVTLHESSRIAANTFVIHTAKAIASALRAPMAPSAQDSASIRAEDGTFAIHVARSYSTEFGAEDALHSVLFGAALMGEPVRNESTGVVSKVPSAIKVAKAP